MSFSTQPLPAPAPAPAPSLPPTVNGHALGVASMLTWAAAFPAAEQLLQTWSPLALVAARLSLAVAVLIPLWLLLEGRGPVQRARWRRGLVIGGLGFGAGVWLVLVAQKMTDPVTVALIASCAPLAGALIEVAGGARRLTPRFALGLGVSILGGVVATSALEPATLGPGVAVMVLSVGLFAWGSHRTVLDFPDLSPLGRTTITLAGAMAAVFAFSLGVAVLGPADWLAVKPSLRDVGPLLVYALVAMSLSQALWLGSVERLGVGLASFHMNIAPFYVMLFMLAFGESWDWMRAAGAAVVALGVIVAQASGARAR